MQLTVLMRKIKISLPNGGALYKVGAHRQKNVERLLIGNF
jgi:hypothetical protein